MHLSILIKPASHSCNLDCLYCFYKADKPVCGKVMSRETAHTLIERALAEQPSSLSFVFSGGEPLLAGLDFYRDFTHFVRKKCDTGLPVYYTLQTNGTLLDRDFAELFKAEGFLIGVSLDGCESTHNALRPLASSKESYKKVLDGIRLLEEYGVPYNILAVMTAELCREPQANLYALSRFSELQLIPYIPKGENDIHKPSDKELASFLKAAFRLYKTARERGAPIGIRDFDGYISLLLGRGALSCAGGGGCGGYIATEADGSTYPCDFYMDQDHILGNVSKNRIHELVTSDKMKAFLTAASRRDGECRGCRFEGLCRGGCPRLGENGKYIYCRAYFDFFTECAPDIISLAKTAQELINEKT